MNIKQVIANVPDFPKPGIMFRDISPLLAHPQAFAWTVKQIAKEWEGKVEAIAALDARGFLFGTPVALALNIPFVPVRKKGKLPGDTIGVSYALEYGEDRVEIKRDAIEAGAKVLVIEDLLATGGTASAACQLIETAGGIVAGCAFVIELGGLGGRAKLDNRTIQSLAIYEEE